MKSFYRLSINGNRGDVTVNNIDNNICNNSNINKNNRLRIISRVNN